MRKFPVVSLLAVGGLIMTALGQQPTSKTLYAPWRDSATGLTWAGADNGIGASAAQAAYYCRTLTLGGHRGWRLPGIEELQKLFGGPPDTNGHHVIGPIKITGWAWSSTPGQHPGEQWALDFGDGGRASAVMGDSGLNRALCVRGKTR
jgi:Protein of unknown function (DUF1566)